LRSCVGTSSISSTFLLHGSDLTMGKVCLIDTGFLFDAVLWRMVSREIEEFGDATWAA
jgi:hypothetical protein